jgi:predicted dehydrogenase
VNLLGPIKRVNGMAKAAFGQRTIGSGPKRGKIIPVEVDTHITAGLEFASGVIATMIMSFDVQNHTLPHIEIYGTEGTLAVPDPNRFGGPVRVFRKLQPEPAWQEIPLINPYYDQSRAIGAADLAHAIKGNRPHRATGELGTHILDAMIALGESVSQQCTVEVETSVQRPAMIPPLTRVGVLDD